MSSAPAVVHNPAENRYEIALEGHLAVAEYVMDGGKQVLTHTLVPAELRGRGLAEALVRTALNDARAAGRRVVPQCSYVERFMQRNKEYQSLLAE